MKLANIIRLLVGSTAIYIVLAMSHGCGSSGPDLSAAGGSDVSASNGGGIGGAATSRGATSGVSSGKSGAGGAVSTGSIMNPVPDADANQSGSRLRAKYYTGADGSRQWISWYDNQRKEDCTFQPHSDGTLRCAPFPQTVTAGSFYSDAGCKTDVASRIIQACSPAIPQPKYAIYYDAFGCSYTYRWASIMQPYAGTTLYYKNSGVCTATAKSASYEYFSLNGEVAASEFVAATTTIE